MQVALIDQLSQKEPQHFFLIKNGHRRKHQVFQYIDISQNSLLLKAIVPNRVAPS